MESTINLVSMSKQEFSLIVKEAVQSILEENNIINKVDEVNLEKYNIPIARAAKLMGKDQQYIRLGLIEGRLPFGSAFKRPGSTQYDYYISPKLFCDFTGIKLEQL